MVTADSHRQKRYAGRAPPIPGARNTNAHQGSGLSLILANHVRMPLGSRQASMHHSKYCIALPAVPASHTGNSINDSDLSLGTNSTINSNCSSCSNSGWASFFG